MERFKLRRRPRLERIRWGYHGYRNMGMGPLDALYSAILVHWK